MDTSTRLKKASVPDGIDLLAKWELMLRILDDVSRDVPALSPRVLPFIGDTGYGDVPEFCRALNEPERPYLRVSTTAV